MYLIINYSIGLLFLNLRKNTNKIAVDILKFPHITPKFAQTCKILLKSKFFSSTITCNFLAIILLGNILSIIILICIL